MVAGIDDLDRPRALCFVEERHYDHVRSDHRDEGRPVRVAERQAQDPRPGREEGLESYQGTDRELLLER